MAGCRVKLWEGRFWAEDTFRRGGHVVDRGGILEMRDKVQHLLGGHALWLLLALAPLGFVARLVWWTVGAVGIEVLEAVRLATWWAATEPWRRRGWTWSWKAGWANNQTTIVGEDVPPPPPAFADRPSWRDLVADVAGLVPAAVYVWLLRGTP